MLNRRHGLQTGFSDLGPLRILVTIIFVMALIAIPNYSHYYKRNKIMLVMNELHEEVEAYYKKENKLPELEKINLIAENENIDIKDNQVRINLSVIDLKLEGKYLQLHSLLENGKISWKCKFSGELYKSDIPELQADYCQQSIQALPERAFAERLWIIIQSMWKLIIGYAIFVLFTFLF